MVGVGTRGREDTHIEIGSQKDSEARLALFINNLLWRELTWVR